MTAWHLLTLNTWAEYEASLSAAGADREDMEEAAAEWDSYLWSKDFCGELENDY